MVSSVVGRAALFTIVTFYRDHCIRQRPPCSVGACLRAVASPGHTDSPIRLSITTNRYVAGLQSPGEKRAGLARRGRGTMFASRG